MYKLSKHKIIVVNNPSEFYEFLKAMDVYKEKMAKDSTLILSTDSDFMKYFKEIN